MDPRCEPAQETREKKAHKRLIFSVNDDSDGKNQ